ncbi:hypothetical protein ACLMJK_007245 [Lecanora helva]
MSLPAFVSSRRQRKSHQEKGTTPPESSLSEHGSPSPKTIKAATRTRFVFSIATSLLFLTALIFLILVEVGNTSDHHPVVGSIYFIKLDLSHIIPRAVPQAHLINSIAQSLGLHDFYQVGLWNFCEGYGDRITDCSKPRTLYWFDPVEILLSELFAGATITPLSTYTRWATLPIALFTFASALTTTAATIIATAMFIIFKKVIHSAEDEVNIVPEIGVKMFAFMWVASVCSIFGWLVQVGLCCCCASRRDVRRGKKRGRRSAWRRSGEASPREMRKAREE